MHQETAQKYDVNQMPTFILIQRGEVVDQFSGANVAVLRQKLEGLVKGDGGAGVTAHAQVEDEEEQEEESDEGHDAKEEE